LHILAFTTIEYPLENPRGWGAERRFRALSRRLIVDGIRLIGIGYSEVAIASPEGIDYTLPKNKRWKLLRLVIAGTSLTRRLKCDALYAYHSDPVEVVVPTYLCALICGKPFFVVVHDDAKRTEDSSTITQLIRTELTGRRRHFPRKVVHLSIDILRRIAIRRARACICVSQFSANYALHVLHSPSVVVTGNGVEDGWFQDKEGSKKFEAVFMGRIERRKGVDSLLEAWRLVNLKLPDARLVLIGSMEKAEGRHINRLVSELRLAKNVTFAGYVSDSEAERLVQSSQVFILPSRKEGFGLVVAEAMASGVPCIISDIPALLENFQGASQVVSADDSDALAQAILTLLGDAKLRERLAREGRALAKEFTWDKVSAREAAVIFGALDMIPVGSRRK